ncbi:MAG: N-methylhydantoinase A/acetone carboxylase, beta subunit [Deltaproteobacteria bacterium]|nr:N-methylhydantoinase A/acetone carboxylase, beta subunit [Deltaproteobacteria bacterium]
MFEIMIDTGGTFTDGVLIDDKQSLNVAKAETQPLDPARSILNCIARLAEERGMTQEELLKNTSTVTIGTTLPTNCILEGKGAKCCLIHTKGFRDVFELGRTIPKTDIYNLKVVPPRVLIPRYLRFGVEERVQYDGTVVKPLKESDVRKAVKQAKAQGVEVPVVCFLHSYVNPVHEEQAAEIIKADYPNVVVSSRILRRWIEYDRASTAAYAAYVKPLLTSFMENLKKQLKEAKFKGTLLFSTGLGDVTTADLALENPGIVIGSGLATGALCGRFLAELCDFDNVVTYDMGGTSLDIAVLQNRTISTTSEMVIGDQKNSIESMDITSIGAGGGSIGWIDRLGVLRVGPQSGGADPGPACYGKGGQEPTVTDADVVLGYVPTDYFLGGTIRLDRKLAEKAIDEKVAKPSGMDTVQAAYTIASLEEAVMGERVFLSVVEKGYDPRDFVLVVGGGAGPVHAVAMAKRLGMKKVYVPKHSAVFSALGGVVADYGYVLNRFLGKRDDEAKASEAKALYNVMEKEAKAIFARQGISEKAMALVRGAEMRYYGQLRDIDIFLPETTLGSHFDEATLKELIATFHTRHRELYGHSDPTLPVTIALLKLRVIGKRRPFTLAKVPLNGADPGVALKRKRPVYWKERNGFVQTPCYDGDKLHHGAVIPGPAIIEEKKTTVVIPPGCVAEVDAYDNYLVTMKG